MNCGNGNYFTKTINANSTFTFSNPPSSGTSFAFTLELTHSSGTVTWPSSVKWNADDHASGMYFVKMIAGDYMDTRKLMLLK